LDAAKMGKFEIQTLKMNFRFIVLILTKTKRAGSIPPALKQQARKI
jgi:hypothetical protein